MKKYENMNDSLEAAPEKKRFSLNPFVHLYGKTNGKGVEKDDLHVLEKPGIANYFKLMLRRFNQLFTLNIMMILGNFPVFFAFLSIAYTTREVLAPDSQLYPMLQGAAYFDNSPIVSTLLGIFGRQDTMSVMTTASFVLLGLTLLVFLTFGLVNTGVAYIIRNIVRGEPVFIWSDFWYSVKKNFKQGLIFGIIDLLMIFMLVFDLYSYRANAGLTTMYTIMYFISYAMTILYFFIRMYPYLLIVTFDMKMTKVIKNSIFFSILGIKRNIMALVGTLFFVIVDMFLITVFLPIGIILPFIILFGLLQYTWVYCAFPNIKRIMIDPYYKEVKTEDVENNEEATDC